MLRIRTTLDSVTKVVGSTYLISKFSRLKISSATVDCTNAEKILDKTKILASNNSATATPAEGTETTMKPPDEDQKNIVEEETDKHQLHMNEKPFVATKKSTSDLDSAANVSAQSSSSTMAKQTLQLFHPAALSANMDETSKTLAQHINSYFVTSTPGGNGDSRPQQHSEEKDPLSEPALEHAPHSAGEHIPVLSPVAEAKSNETTTTSPVPPPPEKLSPQKQIPSPDSPATESPLKPAPVPTTSTKKGFTHYLSDPRPSVQAFVGSYIAPLVPKFRGDSKSITVEKDKSSPSAAEESTVDKAGEKTASEDEKTDKARLSQREKVGSSEEEEGEMFIFLHH